MLLNLSVLLGFRLMLKQNHMKCSMVCRDDDDPS